MPLLTSARQTDKYYTLVSDARASYSAVSNLTNTWPGFASLMFLCLDYNLDSYYVKGVGSHYLKY
jgi:hypothetical protein